MQHYALFRLSSRNALGVLSSDPTRCCNDKISLLLAIKKPPMTGDILRPT